MNKNPATTNTHSRPGKRKPSRRRKEQSGSKQLITSLAFVAFFLVSLVLSQTNLLEQPAAPTDRLAVSITPIQTETPARQSPDKPTAISDAFREPELTYLARLCVFEVRGMSGDVRDRACSSVVSTVIARTKAFYLSDGTIATTLDWHSGDTWQFVGYLVHPCRSDMPSRYCPDSYPTLFEHFREIIRLGTIKPLCAGYLHYNSIPGGFRECVIDDKQTGQWIDFYGQSFTPTPEPTRVPQKAGYLPK